jgi:PleD family two-component response regulator
MQEGIIKWKVLGGRYKLYILDFDIIESGRTEVLSSEPPIYDLGGKTILVVEDNAMNQMVIKMITKKWLNTTVLYANNGQEGLDVLKQIKLILF